MHQNVKGLWKSKKSVQENVATVKKKKRIEIM